MPFKLLFRKSKQAVCYEVRLAVAPQRIEELDKWLEGHIREMLAFPGFQGAQVYRPAGLTEDGWESRVVAYEVRSRRELDSYLHTHARRMRQEGIDAFGTDLKAERDIQLLAVYEPANDMQVILTDEEISGGLPICGNCHLPVPGRFCTHCGQEDRTYLLSLRELLGEFFGELTNFDSRFFRSLKPLLFRPGLLTVEYVRGRRQHYFPPIRMYIIISLLFFFFAALMTDSTFGDFDAEGGDGPTIQFGGESKTEDPTAAIKEVEAQLESAEGMERTILLSALERLKDRKKRFDERKASEAGQGGDTATVDNEAGEAASADPDSGAAAMSADGSHDAPGEHVPGADEPGVDVPDLPPMPDMPEATEESKDEKSGGSYTFVDFSPGEDASEDDWEFPSLNMNNGDAKATGWGSPENNERMERGAVAVKENPKAFVRAVVDNIPGMMFVFLPLIALALKILYLFSGRYYVEHLTFSLHLHSAVFVLLLLWILFGELVESMPFLETLSGWVTAAVWIYIPVYLYKSMRRVYGQGHLMTSLKFFLLTICYLLAASITSVFVFVATIYQQA